MTIDYVGSPWDDGYGVIPAAESDGEWVKYADHVARLAQLAQEQATLQEERDQSKLNIDSLMNTILKSDYELETLRAALGETRQALQRLVKQYRDEASVCLSLASLVPQLSDEWRRWMDFTGMAHRHANDLEALAR